MAGKDGWIRHRGGKCPVDEGTVIDVRHRDGEIFESIIVGSSFACSDWAHTYSVGDIMAWRPSIIEEEKQEMEIGKITVELDSSQAREIVENAIAEYQSTDGPLDWRDRIREIDAYMIGEKEAHKRLIESAETERAELVAKLAAEGLALCAVPAEVVEDMSDWRNWRRGDLITVLYAEGEAELVVGNEYSIVTLEPKEYTGICPVQLKNTNCCWLDLNNMRWHSRP